MSLRLPLFVIFSLFTSAASAAPAAFSLIDGQNAFDVLEVPRSASDAEIRSVWAAKVKTVHSDITHGSDLKIRRYNAAYECLKPAVRADYESWLDSGVRRGAQQKPRARPRTEEEEIELTYNYILRASREGVADMKEKGQRTIANEIAIMAKFHILYCLRYMPDTTFTPEQLSDLILYYALNRSNDSNENRVGNFAAALGAIDYLKEMTDSPIYPTYRATAKMFLKRLENSMKDLINGEPESAYRRMAVQTFEYMTGRAFARVPPPPTASRSSGCEQHLETTARVQGSDGRWYDIPIRVEVKLGH